MTGTGSRTCSRERAAEASTVWRRIRTFYSETLPRTYREAAPFLLAAGALMFVPAIVSYFVVLANPDAAYAIASANLIDKVHHHQLWTNIPPADRISVGGEIMANNIWVSMVAFSLGVVFGLPVIYVMISNGIHLGGVFGLTQAYGLSGGLFEFVIGHGVLEGNISPSNAPFALKVGIGLITGLFFYSYLILAGRPAQSSARSLSSR